MLMLMNKKKISKDFFPIGDNRLKNALYSQKDTFEDK